MAAINAAPPGYNDNGDGTFTDPMTGETIDADGNPVGTPARTMPNPIEVTGQRDPILPIDQGSPGTGTSGGFDLGGFIQKLVSDPSLIQSLIQNGGLIAGGLRSAHALNDAAGDYTTLGEKYAGQLDPYGSYRKSAAERLAALQADPSSIKDTPGYKFSLEQGLGAVANRDNRVFGVGAGSTNPDLMNYAQGLASKTYNDTIKQLQDQAGVGIGPGASASVLNTGMQGNIQAKLGAVNAQNSIIAGLTQPGQGTRTTGPGGATTTTPDASSPISSLVNRIVNSISTPAPRTVLNDTAPVTITDQIYNQGGDQGDPNGMLQTPDVP